MKANTLFATTAILALATASTFAESRAGVPVKPVKLLWNQNSNFSYGIVSQNFSSAFSATYDAAAADDFAVPAGKTWKVKEVDVTGVYFNGSGPASSEVVTFYKNSKGYPGKVLKSLTLTCTDSAGSFACALPRAVKLNNSAGTKKATYWVSVVANLNFTQGGEWGWITNTTVHGHRAVWENPGGDACKTWCHINNDLAFDLKGTSF
jgi:hypothetical protein